MLGRTEERTPAACKGPGPRIVAPPLSAADAAGARAVWKPRVPAACRARLERRQREAVANDALFVPPALGAGVGCLPGVAPPAVPAAAAITPSLSVPLPLPTAGRLAVASSAATVAIGGGGNGAIPLALQGTGRVFRSRRGVAVLQTGLPWESSNLWVLRHRQRCTEGSPHGRGMAFTEAGIQPMSSSRHLGTPPTLHETSRSPRLLHCS